MIKTNWRRTNMKRKLGDLKWAALFVRAARLRVAATRRYSRWYDSYWGIPECYFHTVAAVPIFALAACQRLDLAFGDDPRDDGDPHNDGLAHFARAWSARLR